MPDITGELYTIRTDELGGDVLTAIYNALTKIDNFIGPVDIDISEEQVTRVAELIGVLESETEYSDLESYNITIELETIKNSRYGSEIRMAIHDALDKLNYAAEHHHPEPTPGPSGYGFAGLALPIATKAGVTIIGYAEEA